MFFWQKLCKNIIIIIKNNRLVLYLINVWCVDSPNGMIAIGGGGGARVRSSGAKDRAKQLGDSKPLVVVWKDQLPHLLASFWGELLWTYFCLVMLSEKR